MKIQLRVAIPMFVLVVLGSFGSAVRVSAQPKNHLKPLLTLQRTTPEKRFDANRKKGDFRFMGIRSFTLDVPAIVGGQFNSIVSSFGVEPVEGTSDVIESDEQKRAQSYARSFAEEYNRTLLNYIAKTKLPATHSPVTRELRQLQTANVKADVQNAIKKRDFRLLSVPGFSSKAVGVPLDELKSVERYKTRVIGQSMKQSKETEVQQLKVIARSYAAEYNYYLLDHLQYSGNSWQSGTQKGGRLLKTAEMRAF